MKRPKLGQFVAARDVLAKSYRANSRVWLRQRERIRTPQPIEGIYIGYRTLADGLCEWHHDCTVFKPTHYFEAWLIVPNERVNPIRVHPEDCYYEN